MKKSVLNTIGTYVIVGLASTAGAALWTNVLEYRYYEMKNRFTRPKANNVIDFRKARKRMSR